MVERFVLISPYIFVLGTLIIGLLTPGYNHLSRTVSRLLIEEYGHWEALVMLQMVVSLIITGAYLSRRIRSKYAATVVRWTMYVTAIVTALIAIVPTDPVDNMRLSEVSFTTSAKIHIGLVMGFILLTPISINKLYRTFREDKDFKKLARKTAFLGYSAFMLSVIWFIFFYFGIGIEYRGIFQKFIMLPVVYWFILFTRKLSSLKP